jgi:hypothetical protein
MAQSGKTLSLSCGGGGINPSEVSCNNNPMAGFKKENNVKGHQSIIRQGGSMSKKALFPVAFMAVFSISLHHLYRKAA